MQPSEDLIALTNLLTKYHIVLTSAESCTGGLLAGYLTELSGSSQWFGLGFVTYSNQAKIDVLGVSPDTLHRHGAVSQETVVEMAKGALSKSTANIAISISGIAGPTGNTSRYPVGSVWFAIASHHQSQTYLQYFYGNRQAVRKQAVHYSVKQLLRFITQSF